MVRKGHEVGISHRGRKISQGYLTYVIATTDEWFDAGEDTLVFFWASGDQEGIDQEGIARLLDQGWVADTW